MSKNEVLATFIRNSADDHAEALITLIENAEQNMAAGVDSEIGLHDLMVGVQEVINRIKADGEGLAKLATK